MAAGYPPATLLNGIKEHFTRKSPSPVEAETVTPHPAPDRCDTGGAATPAVELARPGSACPQLPESRSTGIKR
jgi:hypothetical protein